MRFLMTLGAASLFAVFCSSRIPARRNFLYVLAVLLALLTAAGTAVGLASCFRPRSGMCPVAAFGAGSLATAFFVLVMYAGTLPDSCHIRQKLLFIRGKLSIIAGLLTLGHNLSAGQIYFVRFITEPGAMSPHQLLATVCSLVMLAIMLPLFVTSFPAVRRRMPGHSWKRLQRWTYLFYGLTYVHVVLLFLPDARASWCRLRGLFGCSRKNQYIVWNDPYGT